MYYSITGTMSYLTQAKSVWDWMHSEGNEGLDFIYQDGLSACNASSGLYTYNQGVMLAAAGYLYAATQNQTYLTSGNATLNAVVNGNDFETYGILTESTCDSAACTGNNKNDNAWSYKGILMRGVQYFLDAADDPAITALYSSWIGYQAAAIRQNAQASDGDVGNVWYQKGTQVYNSACIGMAINAGNAAAKYGTSNGSFTC
ncbi:glycoside hydrolase [Mycena galericulata]|nr:glycoside hydrolase [Mycena galericulata]